MRWDFARLIDQVRAVCEITPGGCWLWRYGAWADRGLTDEHEYPRLMIAGERKPVARWVLEADGQPQPPDTEPCHRCDWPPCVAPHHLRWGSHQSNMAEMGERRRSGAQRYPERVPRGDRHFMHLNPDRRPRGSRSGNFAHGDDHWTRRTPEQMTWTGTDHHAVRLTPEIVRDIRARGKAGAQALAISQSLGVGRTTVRAVLEGRTWKHVT
jgi:hypothetical protein